MRRVAVFGNAGGGKSALGRDLAAITGLPLAVHALWVTKRLVKGLFAAPQSWPEGSPVVGSSIASYRVLWPCDTRLTPKYRSYTAEAAQRKRVFHFCSRGEILQFLESMRGEHSQGLREAHRRPFAAELQAASRR